MSTIASPPVLRDLVGRLDAAVRHSDPHALCAEVKAALVEAAAGGVAQRLPARLRQPVPAGYARRLVHRDPQDRYSVLAMVWGPGQGTPLHDHAGVWCVECVTEGKIRVTSYEAEGEREGDLYRFRQVDQILAGPGEAGALIPPYEYHTIDNPFAEAAVTIHVYRGEMTFCHAFWPEAGGRWRRERRELAYTT